MEEGQVRTAVPSYLGWSIFNTLCCCLPLGIIAIIYSNKVQNSIVAGDTDAAVEASSTAKNLNISALVCGIILLTIYIALKVSEQQA